MKSNIIIQSKGVKGTPNFGILDFLFCMIDSCNINT